MSPARKSKPGDKLEASPERVRGYYSTPYGRFMSVTTILDGGVAKPELNGWYSREAALRAIDAIPQLARLRGQSAREQMARWIADAAREKKDAAADLGTRIHRVAEARILGTPHPDPDEDMAPFIRALDRFLIDHDPQFEATELTVANPEDKFAGTGDGWAYLRRSRFRGALVLLDYKSGNKAWPEAALQLSAYQRCPVGWLRDGTEVKPPVAEHAVVVHLRPDRYPDTGYRVIPLDTSDAVYAQFLTIRDHVLGWTKRLAKTALGEPLELESATTSEVA